MNSKKLSLLGLSICIFAGVPVHMSLANDSLSEFSFSSGYMAQKGAEVAYNYDVDDNDLILSDNKITGSYMDGALGFTLSQDTVLNGGFFGATPQFTLNLGHHNLDASSQETVITGGGNSPLGVDGEVIGAAFVDGDFDADFEQKQFELGGTLVGQHTAGLSFVPLAGIQGRTKHQNHEIMGRFSTDPNNPRSLMDSDLDSKMIGITLGGDLKADLTERLSFSATPKVNILYAHTTMTAIQDRDSNIGGVPDAVSRDDRENHVVYEPSITLGLNYDFNPFTLGLQAKGAYSYGNALIQLAETEGQPARIDTDNETYSFGVGLRLSAKF